MQSVVARLYAPRDLRWDEEVVSSPTGDEVVAETIYSAISPGTEMAAWAGAPPLRPMKVYPRVVGYCNVARVVDVGLDAPLSPGDIVLTLQSHRSVFKCRSSDILARPAGDPCLASTAYLFHLGYSAALKAGVRASMSVAVIGLGALGLGAVAICRQFGAKVVAVSGQDHLRQCARQMGSDQVLDKQEATEAQQVDVVITTSNSWEDWELALRLARTGGTVAVLGFPGRGLKSPDRNPLASEYFYDKQLTLVACGVTSRLDVSPSDVRFTLKRNIEWIVWAIEEDRIDPSPMLHSLISREQLADTYRRLEEREAGLVTAVIDWGRK